MNFKPLENHLKQFADQHPDIPGFDVLIQKNHRPVFRMQYGYANPETKAPVAGNELYCLYSCSKPITVTAAMRLVESGKLDLDAPASRYLPFLDDVFLRKDGDNQTLPKELKIRHLFTMSAGFTYNMNTEPIRQLMANGEGRIPTTEFARAVAASPLAFAPGERYEYSLCLDVLGGVVEAVADMPFGEYLTKNIFAPLGMSRTGFFTTLSSAEKPAPLYIYEASTGKTRRKNNIYEFGLHPRLESGGAGLLSTVDDYAKFAATMAHNGLSADGYRLLKEETIQMMQTEQLSRLVSNPTFSCAAGPGYGYGLGVRTLITKEGGQRSPLGEFGWDGAAGSYVMIDNQNDLSIFYATHLRGWHTRFGALHAPIRDLTYQCLGI
ncbi:MAG: beta-lactamase family protein [Clostridia bacterium]|nr:beta-lactamase family protein [Clostridia bacterium]